jgi:hypothetical protein
MSLKAGSAAGSLRRAITDRRSQRARMTWRKLGMILKRFPLPRPTIRVQSWARAA